MATNTTYYNFTKPGTLDRVDITVLDATLDQIDTQLHTWSQTIAAVVVRVLYNYTSNSYPARPSGTPAGLAEYVGPVQPSDWQDGDTWVDNS